MRVCQLPHTRTPSVDTEELSQQRAMAQMHADACTGTHDVPQSFGGDSHVFGHSASVCVADILIFYEEGFPSSLPKRK